MEHGEITTAPCIDCGKIRIVQLRNGKPTRERCQHCANVLNGKKSPHFGAKENHPRWNNGISQQEGYVIVLLTPDSPFYLMANSSGYVKRSRLVMAQHLGRCLSSDEHVHHINGDITNDRIENLQILSQKDHILIHSMKWGRTHCPQGHPFDETNTYITKSGTKLCKICNAISNRKSKAKQRLKREIN
jgi:hypothetical protein